MLWKMGGAWSDKYSFIQDNPSPMSFCYQFLDNMKDNQITGQPSNSIVQTILNKWVWTRNKKI